MNASKSRVIDPKRTRREFPAFRSALSGVAYLDSAATSQTPECVLVAMDAYYREARANVHRGMYPLAIEATRRYENARESVARLIGADADEIVWTGGATDGLNMLARSLGTGLKAGDEIVLTAAEHHSNLVPWQQVAKERGAKLRFIQLCADFTLDLDAARRIIGRRTRIVAVTHVSNALGTVMPVREVAALAHAVGATVVVDAAQSVGHRCVDVRALGCDFLVFSGHKCYGPTGIGVLYGSRERLAALPPSLFGGDMVASVTREGATWNDVPTRFEAGTQNIAGAIGLGAAADFMMRIGLNEIERHERDIVTYALRELRGVRGLRVIGPSSAAKRGGVISFALGDVHPHDLSEILASEGVAVRGGYHCAEPIFHELHLPGSTRASFGIYSDRRDVDRLIKALRKAAKVFGI